MKTITQDTWWGKLSHEEKMSFTGIVKYNSGTIQYVFKGTLHRLDGPAIVHPSGREDYYINDVFFIKKDYWKHPEVIKNSKEFQDLLKYKELT